MAVVILAIIKALDEWKAAFIIRFGSYSAFQEDVDLAATID